MTTHNNPRTRMMAVAAWVGAASICASSPATASSPSLPQDWQIGGMIMVSPRYEGSSEMRVMGVPFIAPAGLGTGNGIVQFKGIDDLRFRLVNFQGFELGPLAGWRFGRDEDDGERLTGLGDVDGGLVGGAYMGYRMGPLFAFASYHHQVTGSDTGGLARFGVEARQTVQPWLTLTGLVGATWASDDYMGAYFGISPLQSVQSGLQTFDAGAGFKDVHVGIGADIPLDTRWTLKLGTRYTHLVGDAADSPVTESRSQLSGTVGLTYRFSFGR
jgi:outer membrane protein